MIEYFLNKFLKVESTVQISSFFFEQFMKA